MYFTAEEFRNGIYEIDSNENKSKYLNRIYGLLDKNSNKIQSALVNHELTNLSFFFKTYYEYIETDDFAKFKNELLCNDEYLKKEAELTFVLVCKTNEHNKSEIYAKLFVSLFKERISVEDYIELALLIDNILFKDFEVLHKVKLNYDKEISNCDYSSLLRLKAAGFTNEVVIDLGEIGKEPIITYKNWALSEIGNKLDKSLF